jgi:hypothetical protein
MKRPFMHLYVVKIYTYDVLMILTKFKDFIYEKFIDFLHISLML